VGKEGFDWAGIAKVGRKVKWPTWTPPASWDDNTKKENEY
jgi:lipoprotein-anchoring transpeptidase ErfK/SrfK